MFLLFFYLEAKWRDGRDAGRPLELEEVHLCPRVSGGEEEDYDDQNDQDDDDQDDDDDEEEELRMMKADMAIWHCC